MESVFADPKGVREEMLRNMKQAQEGGDMTEEELADLVEKAEKGPPKGKEKRDGGDKNSDAVRALRGEGGSGEKKRERIVGSSKEKPVPPVTQSKEEWAGEEENRGEGPEKEEEEGGLGEEEGKELEQGEDAQGGDHEGEGGDYSRITGSTEEGGVDDPKSEMMALKEYCESQFASVFQMLQPLMSRVEGLERATSMRVAPTLSLPSPPRRPSGVRLSVGEGKAGTKEDKGGERRRVVVDREKIEAFVRANPKHPSLKVVRSSKLNQLQVALGLEPKSVDLKVSEWTQDGIYTTLVVAHEAE